MVASGNNLGKSLRISGQLEQVPRGSRIPPAGAISKSVTLTLGQKHQQNDVSYSVII